MQVHQANAGEVFNQCHLKVTCSTNFPSILFSLTGRRSEEQQKKTYYLELELRTRNHLRLFPLCDQSGRPSMANVFQASTPRCLVAPGIPLSTTTINHQTWLSALMWHRNQSQVRVCASQSRPAGAGRQVPPPPPPQPLINCIKFLELASCLHRVSAWECVKESVISLIYKMKQCRFHLPSGLSGKNLW